MDTAADRTTGVMKLSFTTIARTCIFLCVCDCVCVTVCVCVCVYAANVHVRVTEQPSV